jgi:hypothetical protein
MKKLPRDEKAWEEWRLTPRPRLYEAVALTHGIDPRSITDDDVDEDRFIDPAYRFNPESAPKDELGDEFRRRLRIASKNLNVEFAALDRGTFPSFDDPPDGAVKVSMAKFAAWAMRTGWEIDDGFKQLAAALGSTSGASLGSSSSPESVVQPVEGPGEGGKQGLVTVRLPHTTASLEKVFAIIREYWADRSRGDPKQSVVAEAIDGAFGWNKGADGEASRTAQAIAALIRPDDAKERDRRLRR